MRNILLRASVAAIFVLGVGACTGTISSPMGSTIGSPAGQTSGTGGGTAPAGVAGPSTARSSCTSGASLASARLSLISDDQYRNIVHDVFGVTFPVTTNVTGPSSKTGSYSYDESAGLQPTTVQEYQRAADVVASLVTSMPPCTMGGVSAACMETYLRNTLDFMQTMDVTSGLVKAAVFGFVIALMGCYQGYNSRGGAEGVGAATTAAVVSASILILAFDYVLTEMFFAR